MSRNVFHREISHWQHGAWPRYKRCYRFRNHQTYIIIYPWRRFIVYIGGSAIFKKFVETDIQLSGRWASPRGGTIQFSNLEYCLKWHVPTENKLSYYKTTTTIGCKPPSRATPLLIARRASEHVVDNAIYQKWNRNQHETFSVRTTKKNYKK